jgi:hypothetical protein
MMMEGRTVQPFHMTFQNDRVYINRYIYNTYIIALTRFATQLL